MLVGIIEQLTSKPNAAVGDSRKAEGKTAAVLIKIESM